MTKAYSLKSPLWFLLLAFHGILFYIPLLYSWDVFRGKLLFPVPFMALLLAVGLAVSFAHKDKPNFYITIFAYALAVLLSSLALMDAFSSPDPFMKVMEAVYYAIVMFTFILYTQRDFLLLEFIYFIFLTTVSVRAPQRPYFYILAFLGVWVISLRILFLEDTSRRVHISPEQAGRYFMRQVPLAFVLFVLIFVLSLGAARFIPRFNIPLAFMDFLRPQKETLSYIDRERLDSQTQAPAHTFFGSQGSKKGEKGSRSASSALHKELKLRKEKKKPLTWIGRRRGHIKFKGENPRPEEQNNYLSARLAADMQKASEALKQASLVFKEKAVRLRSASQQEMEKGNVVKSAFLQQQAGRYNARAKGLAGLSLKTAAFAETLNEGRGRPKTALYQEAERLSKGLRSVRRHIPSKNRRAVDKALDSLSRFMRGRQKFAWAGSRRWFSWQIVLAVLLATGVLRLVLFLLKCLRRFLSLRNMARLDEGRFFVAVCGQTWPFLGRLGRQLRQYCDLDKIKGAEPGLISLYEDYLRVKFGAACLASSAVKNHILFLADKVGQYARIYHWRRPGFYCWKLSLKALASAIKS